MTLIIGKRSNLSKEISKKCNDCILISTSDIENNLDYFLQYCKNNSVNIIFNNFQSSVLLNDNTNFDEYIVKSLLNTSKILTFLVNRNVKINKIIYTSSSSVYGNNKFCSEQDQVKPINFQGALKVTNEELIKRFCIEHNINYTITRVFNMYGGDDNFSIISKIKNAYVNKTILNVINDGKGLRDYIHINDVVKIYKLLLDDKNKTPKILNIASGQSKRIFDILNFLNKNNISIDTNTTQREEINISIADVDLLNQFIDTDNFTDVEKYLLEELNNKKGQKF